MGTTGSLLKDEDRQEIEDITRETLRVFQSEFMDTLKERLAHFATVPELPVRESKLLPCPPLSSPLKIGFLQKRGHINQGWRRRWCTAANRADNFVISYYDDPGSSKSNGSIECAFMQMIQFNEKETEEAGQHGFKIQSRFLTPSSTERIWYLRAESDADFHCWTHLLNYAIRCATPRRGFEEAMSDAMDAAVLRTASHFDVHGLQSTQGEELDVLLKLVTRVIKAKILERVVDSNPNPKRSRERELQRLVDVATEAVYDAVRTSWTVMGQSFLSSKNTLHDEVHQHLDELRGVRESINSAFHQKQAEQLRDQFSAIIHENCTPLLPRIMPVTIAAMARIVASLFRRLYEMLDANENGLLILSDAVAAAHLNVDRFDNMQYDADLMTIAKLCNSSLPRELDLDGVYFTKLQTSLFDEVRQLQHDAIYTFSSLYPEGMVTSTWREDYNQVLEDSTMALVAIIRNHVATFIQDVIIPIIYDDLMKPLVNTADDEFALILSDIPAHLRSYAKINRVLDECVGDLLKELLRKEVVEGYTLEVDVRDQMLELVQMHQQRYSQRKSSMTLS